MRREVRAGPRPPAPATRSSLHSANHAPGHHRVFAQAAPTLLRGITHFLLIYPTCLSDRYRITLSNKISWTSWSTSGMFGLQAPELLFPCSKLLVSVCFCKYTCVKGHKCWSPRLPDQFREGPRWALPLLINVPPEQSSPHSRWSGSTG